MGWSRKHHPGFCIPSTAIQLFELTTSLPSVSLQMTLRLLGVLMCCQAGRLHSFIWRGWIIGQWLRLSKAKCQVLSLGHNTPCSSRLSQRGRKGPGGAGGSGWTGAQVGKKDQGTLGCSALVWQQDQGSAHPLCWTCWGQFWAPHNKKEVEGLECVQRREQSWGRGSAWSKGGPGGTSWLCTTTWQEGAAEQVLSLLPGNKDRRRQNGFKLCQGRVRLGVGRNWTAPVPGAGGVSDKPKRSWAQVHFSDRGATSKGVGGGTTTRTPPAGAAVLLEPIGIHRWSTKLNQRQKLRCP